MDKTQAMCVDLPKNSTTAQSENASVVGLFTQICAGANKLREYLPSISNTVNEVKEAEIRVQGILKGITAASDPDVKDKLADLRQEFRAVIRVGKDFLENCLSMAKYATDEQHLTEIKEQLHSMRILDKLKVYIDSLSGYLRQCNESFKKFRTTQKEMDDQVSSAKERFSNQHKEASKEASDTVEKYEKAVFKRMSSEGLTDVFRVASSASAAARAMGIISPEMAVLGNLFNFFHTYLARTNEGTAARDVLKQERAREETATKEKILREARNRVVDLRESMLNAEALVEDMKSHLDRASELIEQKKGGLKDLTGSNEEPFEYFDLKNKLDSLQRTASEIVKVIGEDGISPISSFVDLSVENN